MKTNQVVFYAAHAELSILGITDTILAQALNVSQRTIESWRWDNREPSADSMLLIGIVCKTAGILCPELNDWVLNYSANARLLGKCIAAKNIPAFSDGNLCPLKRVELPEWLLTMSDDGRVSLRDFAHIFGLKSSAFRRYDFLPNPVPKLKPNSKLDVGTKYARKFYSKKSVIDFIESLPPGEK